MKLKLRYALALPLAAVLATPLALSASAATVINLNYGTLAAAGVTDSVTDLLGNVYFVDGGTDIQKVAAGGGAATLYSTLANPIDTLTIDPSTGVLYTWDTGDYKVYEIATGGVSTALTASLGAVSVRDLAFGQVAGVKYVYAAAFMTNAIIAVNVSTGMSMGYPTGTGPIAVAVASDGTAYTANSIGNNVSRLTTANTIDTTWGTLNAGDAPYAIAVDPTNTTVYVVANLSDEVKSLAVNAGGAAANYVTLNTGDYQDIATDSAGSLYLANFTAHSIDRIDVTNLNIDQGFVQLAAGGAPRTVSINDVGRLFTAETGNTYQVAIADLAPTITSAAASVPATGTVGVPYGPFTFTADGVGTPTFTAVGALPPGLTLSAAGVLSGTPLEVGAGNSYAFSVIANNGLVTTDSQSITIAIAAQATTPGAGGSGASGSAAGSGTLASTGVDLGSLAPLGTIAFLLMLGGVVTLAIKNRKATRALAE